MSHQILMKHHAILATLAALTLATGEAKGPRDLWVFGEMPYLDDPAQLPIMTNVVRRAAAAGYTGLAFISGRDNFGNWGEVCCRNEGTESFIRSRVGLDALWRMDPRRLARFKALKRACDGAGIDFIPLVWSVGYGSPNLDEPNRVACWLSPDVPYVVRSGRTVFEGRRVEVPPFGELCSATNRWGSWIATTRFAVRPARRYRVSLEVRTENLPGALWTNRGLRFSVCENYATAKERLFANRCPPFEPTQDWSPITFDFHSETATGLTLRATAPRSPGGRYEVRNLTIEEAPVEYVVRRAGTPFAVRDRDTGEVYVEGRDYAPVAGLDRVSFSPPPKPFELALLPGGRIREGARLAVSAYEPRCTYGVQFSTCLSNPDFHAYLTRSAAALSRAFDVRKWFLSLDEVRVGCQCELCVASGKTMGQLFAETTVRMRAAIRAVRPDAEIFMWSDMVDPNHNARADYFHCRTTFVGALEGVPSDIAMVPWWGKYAAESAAILTAHGHEIVGGAFYDAKTLEALEDNVVMWAKALRANPKGRGIMYTTWQNGRNCGNYVFLEDFARLVRKHW